MKKINYRLVYNRKKSLNNEGKALVQVEAYLESKKIYFSTHIYLYPEQWDTRHAIIIKHPQEEELNRMLQEFMLKLQWKELKAWKEGKDISLSLLKDTPSHYKHHPADFFDFGEHWVENSSRKESTKHNLQTTLALLKDFKRSLTFENFTYSFLQEFETYLRKRQYTINTIAKHMKHLKTFINEAINQDLMDSSNYPFRKYKIKMIESKHTFLRPEEISSLENLKLPLRWSHLQHTLDAFLFCCYTGLRYSDFTHLSSDNLMKDQKQIWLVFTSVKTGVETRLPLRLLFQGKALLLLNKYRKNLDFFFRLKNNSLVNKELIRIGKLAQITQHFSFHSARHTNASLLIYQGAQITTVQKLLGHRSIKTTQGYSNIFSDTIIKDLKRCCSHEKTTK